MVSLLVHDMYEKRPIRSKCESGVCIGAVCELTGRRFLSIRVQV